MESKKVKTKQGKVFLPRPGIVLFFPANLLNNAYLCLPPVKGKSKVLSSRIAQIDGMGQNGHNQITALFKNMEQHIEKEVLFKLPDVYKWAILKKAIQHKEQEKEVPDVAIYWGRLYESCEKLLNSILNKNVANAKIAYDGTKKSLSSALKNVHLSSPDSKDSSGQTLPVALTDIEIDLVWNAIKSK